MKMLMILNDSGEYKAAKRIPDWSCRQADPTEADYPVGLELISEPGQDDLYWKWVRVDDDGAEIKT